MSGVPQHPPIPGESTAANDPLGQARIAAFLHGLQELGWTDGRNVRIDTRWGGGNADDIRKYAAELVGIAPDVILASGGSVAGPLLQATRTVPIVFTSTPDPVGAGFVDSLARPGGNATGFTNLEYGLGAKWLISAIAPRTDLAGGFESHRRLRCPIEIRSHGRWQPADRDDPVRITEAGRRALGKPR